MFTHLIRPTLQPQQQSDASLSEYIPEQDEAHSHFRNIFADFHKDVTTDLSSMSQKSLPSQIECFIFANLKCSLRDNARLNTVSSIHAAALLRAIPNPKLGPVMASHEFVIAVTLAGNSYLSRFSQGYTLYVWTYN